jgi:hypothetical protein
MTIHSQRTTNDPTERNDKSNNLDDKSDATDPTGFVPMKFEQEMVTKVIKFSFLAPSNNHVKQVPPGSIHIHLLHAIQAALGEDVVIWNNRSEKIEPINLLQWISNPTNHQKQFKIHQKITGGSGRRRSVRHYIVHRIMTSETISTIKQANPRNQSNLKRQCMLSKRTQLERRHMGHQ